MWQIANSDGTTTTISDDDLRARISADALAPDTLLWRSGMPDWRPAADIEGLFAPPPVPRLGPVSAALDSDGQLASQAERSGRARRQGGQRFSIARHWRGEYRFSVSYWLIGGTVTLAAIASTEAVGTRPPQQWSLNDAITVLAVHVVVAAVSVWMLVGVWRAAGRSAAAGGPRGWSLAAKATLALSWAMMAGMAINQVGVAYLAYLLVTHP